VGGDLYTKLRPPVATPPDEICSCAPDPPLVLQVHLTFNPLSCARCNLEVPPERIGLDSSLIDAVAAWRTIREAFDALWLDSGEYESWAASQLGNPNSSVNLRGFALVRRLSERRRCYLWWFWPSDDSGEVAVPNRCPRCAQALETLFAGERPQGGSLLVCDPCSIAIAV
jgi:hypothetical protein